TESVLQNPRCSDGKLNRVHSLAQTSGNRGAHGRVQAPSHNEEGRAMRRPWSWLGAVVIGLLLGPGHVVVDLDDDAPLETERPWPRPGSRALAGLNFYVWDEDPQAAEEWALALARAPGEQERVARWREIAEQSAVQPTLSVSAHELAFASRVADRCEGP